MSNSIQGTRKDSSCYARTRNKIENRDIAYENMHM